MHSWPPHSTGPMPDDTTTTAQPSIPDRTRASFRQLRNGLSLSRVQSIVAILAGSATVFGAAISLAQIAPSRTGQLVAIVHTAGSPGNVTDATVEVLTRDNALVATLTPDAEGRVTQALREGVYLVRISLPRYAVDVHRIDVQSGQTIEVKTTLRANSSASVDRTVNKGMNAVRRALGFR